MASYEDRNANEQHKVEMLRNLKRKQMSAREYSKKYGIDLSIVRMCLRALRDGGFVKSTETKVGSERRFKVIPKKSGEEFVPRVFEHVVSQKDRDKVWLNEYTYHMKDTPHIKVVMNSLRPEEELNERRFPRSNKRVVFGIQSGMSYFETA